VTHSDDRHWEIRPPDRAVRKSVRVRPPLHAESHAHSDHDDRADRRSVRRPRV